MADKLTREEVSKFILGHYSNNGWSILATPKDCAVDFIATKDNRMHFLKVIGERDVVYLDGIAKNTYIQNAFSNAATPVYAIESSSGGATTYKFVNPNTETRVRIGDTGVARAQSGERTPRAISSPRKTEPIHTNVSVSSLPQRRSSTHSKK